MKVSPDLYVGICHVWNTHPDWTLAMLRLKKNILGTQTAVNYDWQHDKPWDMSRSFLGQGFLDSGCEWMLMVDTDVLPPPEGLEILYSHKLPIVSGLYWRRHPEVFPEVFRFDAGTTQYKPIPDEQIPIGLSEVDGVGMGFCLIHRRVFEKLAERLPKITLPTHGVNYDYHQFFKFTAAEPPFVSEDLYFCVPPTSVVYTSRGPMRIEDVRRGFMVYNGSAANGSTSKVVSTFQRPYCGDLLEITPHYAEPLLLTPNHPVLVRRVKEPPHVLKGFVDAEDVKTSDMLYIPVPNTDARLSITSLHLLSYLGPSFRKFKDGDYFRYRRTHSDAPRVPASIRLTHDLLRVFGLYIAEGYDSGETITFTFNKDEVAYTQLVSGVMTDAFGLNEPNELVLNGARRLTFSSKIISHLFGNVFGHLAVNKHLPQFYPRLQSDELSSLVEGVIDGDGYKGSLTTVSPLLAYGMKDAMTRTRNLVAMQKNGTRYTVKPVKGMLGLQRKRHLIVPIRSIRRLPYEGTVHNLQTTYPSTFTANGVVVHNCMNARMAGFKLYLDSRVRCGHIISTMMMKEGRPTWTPLEVSRS